MTDLNKKILAHCITNAASLVKAGAEVTSAYFERPYRKFFDIALRYQQRFHQLITEPVITDRLRRQNAPEDKVLWYQQLFRELQNIVVDPAEFEYYLEALQTQYYDTMLRQALLGRDKDGQPLKDARTGQPKLGAVQLLTEHNDPKNAWGTIKEVGLEIERKNQSNDLTQRGALHESAAERLTAYEERVANPEQAWGLLTGFEPLDEATKGLKNGDLLVIGGRHGSGKSIISLVIAKNIYKGVKHQPPKNVLLISLEMPKEQYELRLDASYANLPMDSIELGTLNEEQASHYKAQLLEQQQKTNWLYIVDTVKCNALTIEAELQAIMHQFDPDVLIVDYIGLMKANERQKSDHEEQALVVEELRAIARTYKIPVITPVQLNRDKNKDREKSTQRLSRSDNIGATADVVMQIDESEDDEEELSSHITLHITKNRKGATPSFKMYKDFSRMQILNVESPDDMELTEDVDLTDED